MTTTTRYELVVTRLEDSALTSRYEVFIYRWIHAGICGPFTEPEIIEGTYVDYATLYGFKIDGFPKIHGNTATFELVK